MRWTRSTPIDVNLNWLLCGSEGTLATVARAELRLVDRPKIENTRLALVHFRYKLRASLEATPRILELEPAAIELMDKFLLDKTRAAAGYRDRLTFVDGDPEAILGRRIRRYRSASWAPRLTT